MMETKGNFTKITSLVVALAILLTSAALTVPTWGENEEPHTDHCVCGTGDHADCRHERVEWIGIDSMDGSIENWGSPLNTTSLEDEEENVEEDESVEEDETNQDESGEETDQPESDGGENNEELASDEPDGGKIEGVAVLSIETESSESENVEIQSPDPVEEEQASVLIGEEKQEDVSPDPVEEE